MTRSCRSCNQAFEITQEDLAFYEKVSPVFNGKKELIPPPTLCPECRQRRRMAFRNEKNLYNRVCDLCRKEMISMYPPATSFPVYCQPCFWSDCWSACDYGVVIQEDKNILQQMRTVENRVPHLSLVNQQSQNSQYCNYALGNKNCYLTFGNHYEEDCLYGRYSTKNRNCLDYLWCYGSEQCYEILFSSSCYSSLFLDHCDNCSDSAFLIDCKDCDHCLFSQGLRHKSYHIFNQPYSREEYEKKLAEIRLASSQGLERAKAYFFFDFRRKFVFRDSRLVNCEGCFGDNLANCKNTVQVFDAADCEEIKYAAQIDATSYSQDMNFMGYDHSELCYQTIGCTALYQGISGNSCWNSHDISYGNSCFSSEYLFGCFSMNRAKYCILNKQYTKEEYEELVPRIIAKMRQDGEWGEFFPPSLSPFGYNETVAQEYYPLTRAEALQKGFNWSDYVSPPPQVDKIIKASQLPDNIDDTPDDILNWAIECEVTGRPYKIIKQELKFLRDHHLPIPRRHPDQRHLDRMKLRNPRKLFQRKCDNCYKDIQTTYAPNRPERVYCEECYLKEVY